MSSSPLPIPPPKKKYSPVLFKKTVFHQQVQLIMITKYTSHVLQPLDIGCFGPFERVYNADCHKYMREHSCTGVDKYSICGVACKAYSKALSPTNLINSFRKAGIRSVCLPQDTTGYRRIPKMLYFISFHSIKSSIYLIW